MQLDWHVMFFCKSIRPLQQLTGNRIYGVRTYGEMYPFIVSVHLFIQLLNGLFAFLRQLRLEMVETSTGNDCPDSHLFNSLCRSMKLMIHVEESSRSAFYHFQTSQFSSPENIFFRQFRFIGPYLFFQPGH